MIKKGEATGSRVVIQGESGRGKELVAGGLHFNSNREHQPLIERNCSGLP